MRFFFFYTKYISSKLIICFHRSLSPLNPLKFLKEQQNPIEKLPITRISIFQNKKRPCPYTPYQSEGNKCSEVAMRGIGCVIWGSEGVIQSVSEGSLIEMLIVIGMQNIWNWQISKNIAYLYRNILNVWKGRFNIISLLGTLNIYVCRRVFRILLRFNKISTDALEARAIFLYPPPWTFPPSHRDI